MYELRLDSLPLFFFKHEGFEHSASKGSQKSSQIAKSKVMFQTN